MDGPSPAPPPTLVSNNNIKVLKRELVVVAAPQPCSTTTVVAPKSAIPTKENKKTRTTSKKLVFDVDDNMMALLAQHNKKFSKCNYEPRKFSVKEVRMWEQHSGKTWYSLSIQDREMANEWIKQKKLEMEETQQQ
ncbi:hypothetical protein SAMD00019534_031670 [Acytostelium subglobosum LB1]|uniref:hypothetical protein n=1 Tax=Acytostelium subglobosum LB1 TaxID=1410327 RepID=UPI0006452235|nr:hypothetical protein SAMD00019534_031670 [Acytostelium subglobosum LB1]GAM19992.1 hypothetical protein SAMD00019534_031670 [Acytostelium subglobosum LB1]|eukprot:XP_012756754.1 hypothetical protein SAMD00019534_031670 [Acytostelium subglobosum LB1]